MCPGHHIIVVQGNREGAPPSPQSCAVLGFSHTGKYSGLVWGQTILLATVLRFPKSSFEEIIHLLYDEFDNHNIVTIKQV